MTGTPYAGVAGLELTGDPPACASQVLGLKHMQENRTKTLQSENFRVSHTAPFPPTICFSIFLVAYSNLIKIPRHNYLNFWLTSLKVSLIIATITVITLILL